MEHDLAACDPQVWRARGIHHLGGLAKQAEHLAHVDQGLADLAVDGAQKVQGQRDLDHVGVDHHEIAHGQLARLDATRAHRHDDHQARGDQKGLAHVQKGQRKPRLDGGRLVLAHGAVIAVGLAGFGVEILDGFKV